MLFTEFYSSTVGCHTCQASLGLLPLSVSLCACVFPTVPAVAWTRIVESTLTTLAYLTQYYNQGCRERQGRGAVHSDRGNERGDSEVEGENGDDDGEVWKVGEGVVLGEDVNVVGERVTIAVDCIARGGGSDIRD